MCFGNDVQTEKKTTQNQLPDYLRNAAQSNVANAAQVTSQPFKPYEAPRVAGLSGDEQTAADMLRSTAGSTNPYLAQIEELYGKFANTAAPQVQQAPSILGAGVDPRTSSIQDYMSPYISATLTPVLEELSRQAADRNKQINTQMTFGGAFGDARNGVEAAAAAYDADRLRRDAVSNAYSTGFDKAAGLRATDISNLLGVDTTNAGLTESGLQRAITGGTALRDLDKYTTGREVDLAKTLDASGAKQRQIEQAGLDANFAEFMREQGYSAEMIKLFTSVLGATPYETTNVATTEKPDNSGYGLLGSLLGAAAAPFTGGMSLGLGSLFGGMAGGGSG